jgi:hypothetical protein
MKQANAWKATIVSIATRKKKLNIEEFNADN